MVADHGLFFGGWRAVVGDAADAVVADGDVVTGVLVERIEEDAGANFGDKAGHDFVG